MYAAGHLRAPAHPELTKEAAKAAAFPPAPQSSNEITVSLFGGAATAAERSVTFPSEFEAIVLPEGSYGGVNPNQRASADLQVGVETLGGTPSIYVSKRPLLPKATCERYIAAAEAWAAGHGGWTTSRHHSVATTDIPLTSLPELLPRCVRRRARPQARTLPSSRDDLGPQPRALSAVWRSRPSHTPIVSRG